MNYQNKEMLMGAMIVAGYDEQQGGQVYGCPIGGTLVREQWAVDGSGSTYIWAALDDGFREGMTREEAERLVVDALSLAMARDASSGGVIRTVTLDKAGAHARYIGGSEVPTWFEDLPAPNAAAAGMAVG
jgi:20S proteasome subunit beta 1